MVCVSELVWVCVLCACARAALAAGALHLAAGAACPAAQVCSLPLAECRALVQAAAECRAARVAVVCPAVWAAGGRGTRAGDPVSSAHQLKATGTCVAKSSWPS